MFAGQSPVPECVVQTYDIDEPPKLMDMVSSSYIILIIDTDCGLNIYY